MRLPGSVFALFVLTIAIAGVPRAAIIVDFTESGSSVSTAEVGSTITVEMWITATEDTAILGYQFTILWDDTELAYIDNSPYGGTPYQITHDSLANTGPQFDRGGSWLNGGGGEVFLASDSLPAAISSSTLSANHYILASDGTIAIGSLQFLVLSAGADGLVDVTGCIDCVIPVGDGLVDYTHDTIGGTFNGLSIDSKTGGNAVPEPSTAALLGLGVSGVAAIRRRRTPGPG